MSREVFAEKRSLQRGSRDAQVADRAKRPKILRYLSKLGGVPDAFLPRQIKTPEGTPSMHSICGASGSNAPTGRPAPTVKVISALAIGVSVLHPISHTAV
jgi:hypothetical protein